MTTTPVYQSTTPSPSNTPSNSRSTYSFGTLAACADLFTKLSQTMLGMVSDFADQVVNEAKAYYDESTLLASQIRQQGAKERDATQWQGYASIISGGVNIMGGALSLHSSIFNRNSINQTQEGITNLNTRQQELEQLKTQTATRSFGNVPEEEAKSNTLIAKIKNTPANQLEFTDEEKDTIRLSYSRNEGQKFDDALSDRVSDERKTLSNLQADADNKARGVSTICSGIGGAAEGIITRALVANYQWEAKEKQSEQTETQADQSLAQSSMQQLLTLWNQFNSNLLDIIKTQTSVQQANAVG